MKLSFNYLKKEILVYDAKSFLQQGSIIMLRSIFKDAEEKFTAEHSTERSTTNTTQAKIPQNIIERLEAVDTIIGGTSVPSREELDCAEQELSNCIAELSAMR